ncbi:MAG: hypothetical protein EA401_01905 [Planctomycetota bacterium]|nr:MAG: hypothetical protein EA401_01905 [Planctomycetota bacterium]
MVGAGSAANMLADNPPAIGETALHDLAQRLQQRFPGSQFTPMPDLPNDGGLADGHHLPEDYKAWMRTIGHGPIGETGLRIYPGPRLGRQVIRDHQRHGLSDVVVVAGDDQDHFVIYNTRFITWYIHVVVGELALMSALERDMRFIDYLAYLCRQHEPADRDHRAWYRAVPYLLPALVISAILVFTLLIWGAWYVQTHG